MYISNIRQVLMPILCCCFIFPASGQRGYLLDTVEVIATRIPLQIRETGRNITVITSEQIAMMPAQSIDEVLQAIPGLEVQSRGGFGVQGDLLMRGSTFTQVLVLVDGMRLNDPLTGHFNSYVPVSLPEIERIEVLRGAAAALYGADAVGGVINIMTKTFTAQENGQEIGGTLNYGSHELVNGQLGFYLNKGRTAFGGGVSMNQSKGEPIPERSIDPANPLEAYRTSFDIKTIGFSVSHVLSKNLAVRARSAYDHRLFDARYFYTSSPLDKSSEKVANWWNRLQFRHTTGKGFTDLNVAYKNTTDEFVFNPDFPSTNNHRTRLLNTTLNHLREINRNITLMAGLQADRRSIQSNDRGDHADWHMGIYGMGVYRKKELNLTISLRGDYDENYQFEFTPQLNVSYVLPGITFRGSAGRSIRAADYTERYVSNNLPNLSPGRNLGNPDLLAENGWTEEIGVDLLVNPQWVLKATGFARQSDNLIDYILANEKAIGSVSEAGILQPNADYYFAQNIEDVRTFGIELESDLVHMIGDDKYLTWNVGYTYLNTSNREDVISVYISNHARHLVTTSLAIQWGRFDIGINGLYKNRNIRQAPAIGRELSPDYQLWNIRTGFRVIDHLDVQLQVRNLFDVQYQNILGAPMPGRWVMAGFRWQFE